ncbi:hypothetical protein L218DRAFT_967405 [Marasmius fiardii PR-910]|nr:hypothetical protein L218DRAFT_967405 [Marasmius fiardii PR-910]
MPAAAPQANLEDVINEVIARFGYPRVYGLLVDDRSKDRVLVKFGKTDVSVESRFQARLRNCRKEDVDFELTDSVIVPNGTLGELLAFRILEWLGYKKVTMRCPGSPEDHPHTEFLQVSTGCGESEQQCVRALIRLVLAIVHLSFRRWLPPTI